MKQLKMENILFNISVNVALLRQLKLPNSDARVSDVVPNLLELVVRRRLLKRLRKAAESEIHLASRQRRQGQVVVQGATALTRLTCKK